MNDKTSFLKENQKQAIYSVTRSKLSWIRYERQEIVNSYSVG